MGEWRNGGIPHIPGGLKWGTEGIKILGVFLGSENYKKKN